MSRLQDLISNHGFVGLVIGRKRRYDESPFRLRLHDEATTAAEASGSKQSTGTAKIMQSEFGFFALLKRWDNVAQAFHYQEVHGMCPTWLHAIEKNSAENIALSQRDILSSVAVPLEFQNSFLFKVDFPCTDRHPSNMSAERGLQSEDKWCKSHSPCLLHKAASIQAAQFKLVSGHISGMLSMGLSMQAAGTTGLLKRLLGEILAERLVVYHGHPPPYFAAHRKELHQLFLPDSFWDKGRLLHLKQQCILNYFMNGNLEDESEVQFWTTIPGITKENLLPIYTKFIVAALIPHKCPYFNRSKWLGGELNLRWNGLLSTHHGLLAELVARWVSATSDIAVAKSSAAPLSSDAVSTNVLGSQNADAEVDRVLRDRKSQYLAGSNIADPCKDAGGAGNEAVELVEAELDAEKQGSTDANIDWAEFNRANKRKALAWANTKPGPVLVAMQLCMRPSMRFLCSLVKFASEAWQHESLASAAKGERRKSTVVEIYCGDLFDTFRSGIAKILFSEVQGMPAHGKTSAMKVLTFRMLSRSLCAAHQLVMCYGKGCPAMLFGVLKGRVDELLELADCLRDELTQRFLDLFGTREALLGDDAQNMLSTMAHHYRVDILDLERRHASIRRIVQSKSIHTWTVSYEAACSHWILRQSALLRTRFAPKKVKKTISRKKPRRQKQGGGSWRAFVHLHSKGKKLTKASIKGLSADYWAMKGRPDFAVVAELGRLATLARKEGKASSLKYPKVRKEKHFPLQKQIADPEGLGSELESQLRQIRAAHTETTKASACKRDAEEEAIMEASHAVQQRQDVVEHGLAGPHTAGNCFVHTPGNPSVAEFCPPMDGMAKDKGRAGVSRTIEYKRLVCIVFIYIYIFTYCISK